MAQNKLKTPASGANAERRSIKAKVRRMIKQVEAANEEMKGSGLRPLAYPVLQELAKWIGLRAGERARANPAADALMQAFATDVQCTARDEKIAALEAALDKATTRLSDMAEALHEDQRQESLEGNTKQDEFLGKIRVKLESILNQINSDKLQSADILADHDAALTERVRRETLARVFRLEHVLGKPWEAVEREFSKEPK